MASAPDRAMPQAVLLAAGPGARLHELGALEAKPALCLGGRRLADFAVAAALGSGAPRVTAVLGHRPDTLARHLPDQWGDRVAVRETEAPATLAALREVAADGPLLVLPADQIHALDLADLLAAHREGGQPATLAGGPGRVAPCLLDAALLDGAEGDLWDDLLPALARDGRLGTWTTPADAYIRDVDTLDDLLAAALDLQGGAAPCPLPPCAGADPLAAEEGRALAFAVGGLRLSVPRFGARERGRWTLIEDSLVLPGARVAPGARLTRTIVAPGVVVPANLVVGEDRDDDARWFRVTPGGATLVTAPMLARRAAERMRAQIGARASVTPPAKSPG